MEGAGLFTIANYRKCAASAIYVISDVIGENVWELGWSERVLDTSIDRIIDWILWTVQEGV